MITKSKNNWPTILFETEHFPFETKTIPGQIRTQEHCSPRYIPYRQAKLDATAEKFEIMVNQDTSDSNDSV